MMHLNIGTGRKKELQKNSKKGGGESSGDKADRVMGILRGFEA